MCNSGEDADAQVAGEAAYNDEPHSAVSEAVCLAHIFSWLDESQDLAKTMAVSVHGRASLLAGNLISGSRKYDIHSEV